MQRYKKGQYVKVINCINGHGFDIGEVVKIKQTDPMANVGDVDYMCSNDSECWYLTDEEIELVLNNKRIKK